MRTKAMLLALFSATCTVVHAQESAPNEEQADRVRAIQRQIVDLKNIGRLKTLDPSQRQQREQLLAELRKLGAAQAVKSGPQVGEGINGAFFVHGLNGPLAGKNFCPV